MLQENLPLYLFFCLHTSQRSPARGECELAEHATTAFVRVHTSAYQKEKGFLTAIWPIDLIHK